METLSEELDQYLYDYDVLYTNKEIQKAHDRIYDLIESMHDDPKNVYIPWMQLKLSVTEDKACKPAMKIIHGSRHHLIYSASNPLLYDFLKYKLLEENMVNFEKEYKFDNWEYKPSGYNDTSASKIINKIIDEVEYINGNETTSTSSANLTINASNTTGQTYTLNTIPNQYDNRSDNTGYGYTYATSTDYNNYGNGSTSLGDIIVTKGEVQEMVDNAINKLKNEKVEENNMNTNAIVKNFDFGPCSGDTVHMSMYGIAVKNAAGTWVSYDVKNGSIMDVDILNFNASKLLYKMPVSIKDICAGDVVIHMKKPMFVKSCNYIAKTLTVVDIYNGETKDIILTRSPFGFDFATKVVSLVDFTKLNADSDNPFGSNPMLFALMMGDGNFSNDSLLPLMLMGNGGFDMNNPMMMYFLMSGNKGGDNILPLLFMMNNKNSGCGCGCHNHGYAVENVTNHGEAWEDAAEVAESASVKSRRK